MENTTQVRAHFTGCNIKAGKTVMQFELDPEYKGTLPQLAMMTGTYLMLKLTSDQEVLFVDRNSGEVIEGQEQAFEDDGYRYDEPKALPAAAVVVEDVTDEGAELSFPNYDEPQDFGAVNDPDWQPGADDEAA